ncbi:MAG: hypothetical protein F6K16_19325 [Symploca sp. SIO2B6]|nr:hypothetical protein [Symploca sp. SIO2B6]
MTSPSLNQEQLIFILSFLSNGVANIKASQESLQEQLTHKVTNALADKTVRGYIGEWDVVWGPVVYKAPLAKVATNSMYVARNSNQYVVAIAGTNPSSFYDWLVEDANVKIQVSWPYGNPGVPHAKISKGTHTGLQHLQNKMHSSGKTLLQFLGDAMKNSSSETEIIFTGHSLGGALSPTLALAVLDQEDLWSNGNSFKISVYPSAGPTPGNKDFSIYYGNRLGDSTTRIWNTMDVVPHAWNEDMLSEIPNLYKPEIQLSYWESLFVKILKKLAKGGNYTQLLPTTPGLNGTVALQPIPPLCKQATPETPTLTIEEEASQFVELLKGSFVENYDLERRIQEELNSSDDFKKDLQQSYIRLSSFLKQAIYQHIGAYFVLLDIVEPYCYLRDKNYLSTVSSDRNPSEVMELVSRLLKAGI